MAMSKIRTMRVDDFLNEHKSSWINGTNKILKADEQIKFDGALLYIGDSFIRRERISELFTKIDKRIKISADMPNDLIYTITKYLLERSVQTEITIIDKEIVSLFKKIPFMLADLCAEIQSITKSHLISIDSYVDDDFVTIYSIDQVRGIEPRKDDVVCRGLAVRVTIMGLIEIYPFSFRMSCSNGAIHRIDELGNSKWSFQFNSKWAFQFNGGREDYKGWFAHVKNEYEPTASSVLKRISSLTEKTVKTDEIGKFLHVILGRQNPHRRRELDSIIVSEDSINAYDLWNLTTSEYTNLANENHKQSFKYFKLGGAIGDFLGRPYYGKVNCVTCGNKIGEITRSDVG